MFHWSSFSSLALTFTPEQSLQQPLRAPGMWWLLTLIGGSHLAVYLKDLSQTQINTSKAVPLSWESMFIHISLSLHKLPLRRETLGFSCPCDHHLFHSNIPLTKNALPLSFLLFPSYVSLSHLCPKTLSASSPGTLWPLLQTIHLMVRPLPKYSHIFMLKESLSM